MDDINKPKRSFNMIDTFGVWVVAYMKQWTVRYPSADEFRYNDCYPK